MIQKKDSVTRTLTHRCAWGPATPRPKDTAVCPAKAFTPQPNPLQATFATDLFFALVSYSNSTEYSVGASDGGEVERRLAGRRGLLH